MPFMGVRVYICVCICECVCVCVAEVNLMAVTAGPVRHGHDHGLSFNIRRIIHNVAMRVGCSHLFLVICVISISPHATNINMYTHTYTALYI